MAIINDALKGKISWETAAVQIGNWFQQVAGRSMTDPVVSQAVNALQTDVKQGVSNALALADTEMGVHLADATATIETAADAMLTRLLGPAAIGAVPIVNAGIETAMGVLHSALHAKELEWKSKLTSPTTPAATK